MLEDDRVVYLRGNHEQMMYDAWFATWQGAFGHWLKNGGEKTIDNLHSLALSADEQDDIDVIETLIPEGEQLQNGDIAIVKRYISGTSGPISYTSYVYDKDIDGGWAATDGNYSASNVFLKNKIEILKKGDYNGYQSIV